MTAGAGRASGRSSGRTKPARTAVGPHASRNAAPHTARKRFGQHFLVDPAIIEGIVRVIDPQPEQALVEIGPGLGALTRPLLQRCGALTVIELDRDLAARMRLQSGLHVVQGDVLKVDFADLAAGRKLRVVGNLPYNSSTPILFHLLGCSPHVQDQHFMLQKEVVQRMAAAPGSKAYGRLSVMLQWRYRIDDVLDVPPDAFDPPPRVDSAVVRMVPLPVDASVDAQRLSALVSVAFSQRRKVLRHTLGQWLQDNGVQTPFDLQRRAEEVPVEQYLALARRAPP